MAIKATGTITRNHGDGQRIDVAWDPSAPVREWYFYTNQQTVWRVRSGDWKTDALIAFAFDGAEQDYDEFRNFDFWVDRYGDRAPVVEELTDETDDEEKASTPVYTLANVIEDGCFIPKDFLEDLAVTAGWGVVQATGIMPGTGKYEVRNRRSDENDGLSEEDRDLLGEQVLDIYLNQDVRWRGVPAAVWDYKIGGFQVLRKWLSYRDKRVLGRDLTVAEARTFSSIARRLTEIVSMQGHAQKLRSRRYRD